MESGGDVKISHKFGALLRRHRLAAGLSQQSLAERAGMSIYGISALERGYRKTPQFETLALLAGALALSEEERRQFVAAAQRPEAVRGRGSVTVGPWPNAASESLPIALTRFVGRKAELEEIAGLVREHRFVTITGAGGTGKTQTALRAAMTLSDTSMPSVCFVNLAAIHDPSLVAAAIANALHLQGVPTQPVVETLIAFLKKKSAMLTLDNCEHVVAEAANVVASLLAACPDLRILATSREPLRTAGERAYRLPSLDQEDAVALFVDRARAADAHFTLTDKSNRIVGAICERLSGIPLAIELAAAQVAVLPLKALATALDVRLGLIRGGDRIAPARQQTMQAAIDWSYELLHAAEQRLFERLSVFVGGCRIDAAQIVCPGGDVTADDVLPLISSLVSKSMLVVDAHGPEPRYRMLEPFREYAREKLILRSEQHALAHRHAVAYRNLAEELLAAFDTQPDYERVGRVRAEVGNLRQALEFALAERSDVALGQRLVAALVFNWRFLGAVEARRWTTLARNLLGEGTPPQVVAGLSCVDAIIANNFQEFEDELAASSAALEIYKDLGDEHGIALAEAWALSARWHLGQADLDDAVMAALARARRLGLRKQLAATLRLASNVAVGKGDLSKARAHLAEAAAIAKACGAERELAIGGLDRAECEFAAGNVELALEYASEALRYFRAADDITLVPPCLTAVSHYLFSLARYEAADTRAREALTIASSQGAKGIVTDALWSLALIGVARPPSIPRDVPADHARAARILGFLNGRPSPAGAFMNLEQEYDRALYVLQKTVGDDPLAKLMSEGGALTEDQAVQLALS